MGSKSNQRFCEYSQFRKPFFFIAPDKNVANVVAVYRLRSNIWINGRQDAIRRDADAYLVFIQSILQYLVDFPEFIPYHHVVAYLNAAADEFNCRGSAD